MELTPNFLLLLLPILLFSVIGSMGNLAEYQVGKRGADEVYSRYPNITPEKVESIDEMYQRWGSGLLVLIAIPMLGALLSVSAGILNIRLYSFIVWVVLAKFVRNVLIVFVFGGILQLLF